MLPLKYVHVDKGLPVRLTIREFLHSKEVLADLVPIHLLEYVNTVPHRVWFTESTSCLIGPFVASGSCQRHLYLCSQRLRLGL